MMGWSAIRPILPMREQTCPRRTALSPSWKQRSASARKYLRRWIGWPLTDTAYVPDVVGQFQRVG